MRTDVVFALFPERKVRHAKHNGEQAGKSERNGREFSKSFNILVFHLVIVLDVKNAQTNSKE